MRVHGEDGMCECVSDLDWWDVMLCLVLYVVLLLVSVSARWSSLLCVQCCDVRYSGCFRFLRFV